MGSLRRFVMGATDTIAIATMIAATIVGAAVGAPIGSAMDLALGGRGFGVGLGALVGAIAGFLPAALVASIAMGLSETAANTRRVARSIAGIAAAGSDEADDRRPAAATDWLREDDGAKGSVSTWLAATATILAIGGGGVLIGNQAWRRGAAILNPDLLQRRPIQIGLAVLAVGLVAAVSVWRWPAFAGTLMLAGAAGVLYGTGSATSIVSGPAIAAFVAGSLVAFAASYSASR